MKKKIISGLFTVALMLVTSLTANAGINVELDGRILEFDVSPEIINGRTMVPMRGIFEALGADIAWEDSTKTVTAVKDSRVIKTTIGNNVIDVDGQEIVIDTAPLIKDGRTLVPVRFISESLGYRVRWEKETTTVSVVSDKVMEVHFIDVGQADSALIIQGEDALLIDGGNEEDGNMVSEYIKNQGVEDLDYVICTHGHEDHVGGLPYVIENIKTDIVICDNNYDSGIFRTFMNGVADRGIILKEPSPGETFNIGKGTVTIVAPVADFYSDYNDNSVVLRIEFKNNSFLFTGDAGIKAEADILATGAYLYSDVLKTGHHGSYTATSIPFMSAVSPKFAVISCGTGNSYGHPHRETLETFKKYGVSVFRTDELGHIVAVSDGENIKFSENPVEIKEQKGETAGSYIGNKNTKKLHLLTCSSLPAEKNREYYTDITAAQNNGYTACRNCNPY